MSTTALVTGATRGIGRALVLELAARGVRVFATGRDCALLATLQEQSGCLGQPCDLAVPEQVLQMYQAARAALGQVEILVNNAGFNSGKRTIADTTSEEFEAQYAVNLRAPYLLCREALRDMTRQGGGRIVNVLSSVVWTSAENMGIYSAMKTGLHGLTRVLRKEARAANVRVIGVYPGGVNTEFRAVARPDYMSPASVARMIADAVFAPDDVVVHELTFRPLVETNF